MIRKSKRISERNGAKKAKLENTDDTNGFGTLEVSARIGDITADTNDVIVNSIGQSFILASGGEISKLIAQKSGPDIQKELADSNDARLRVTSNGSLPCKKIIHVHIPHNPKKLTDCICDILTEMEEKLQLSSISIPAIGSGSNGLPSKLVAQETVRGLRKFMQLCQPKHLKTVDFVIYHTSKFILKDFESELFPPKKDAKNRFGSLKVSARLGDITMDANDAIVNSIGWSFELTAGGEISRLIAKKGGASIQDELDRSVDRRFRVTGGGNLPCKRIIHVDVPNNDPLLFNCVTDILREAEKQECVSLSIPALATGGLSMPSKVVSRIMASAVKDFGKRQTPKYLRNVDFVIFQNSMLKDYESALALPKTEFPRNWSIMGTKTFMSVELETVHPEYIAVAAKFLETMDDDPSTILSISRVQNKHLYRQFETKKKSVEENCKSSKITRELFHGTSNTEKICKFGFDRTYSGTNAGTAFGRGNYFAVNAEYSAQSHFSRPDSNGERTIILAEVITGDFVCGKSDMKSTPPKPWRDDILYESLVDREFDPNVFVVFHDASAYPSYVIKFKF